VGVEVARDAVRYEERFDALRADLFPNRDSSGGGVTDASPAGLPKDPLVGHASREHLGVEREGVGFTEGRERDGSLELAEFTLGEMGPSRRDHRRKIWIDGEGVVRHRSAS
jgi:hypothetical protein